MRISALLFLLLGLGALTFTGCDDDDGDGGGMDMDNIAEVVAGNPDFSILLAALQEAGLDGTLADESQTFTVFAPNNTAFENAGITADNVADIEGLDQILLYHVLAGGRVASTDLVEGQTYTTTATATGPGNTQLSLLIERAGTAVTLNGDVSVTSADLAAQNGIIHVINDVLAPPTVADLAIANSNLSSLVAALASNMTTDFVSVLSDEDATYTVFAPLNSAFEDAAATIETLTDEQISDVLFYHVLVGNNRQADLGLGTVPTAKAGSSIEVTSLSPVEIMDEAGNTVPVVGFDIQGTNGVVHILEDVLIPNL